MSLLRSNSRFIQTQLVRRAISHVASKLVIEESIVEQVVLHYFSALRRLIIDAKVQSISIFGFGKMYKSEDKYKKLMEREANDVG